jgi:hypothetical protein
MATAVPRCGWQDDTDWHETFKAIGIVIARRDVDHHCVYSQIRYIKDETSFDPDISG